MVPLTFNGKEGDGAEQNFSKVHGPWLGWSPGDPFDRRMGGPQAGLDDMEK
jgi:hypothetical protein